MSDRTGYDVILFADRGTESYGKSLGPYRLATELRRHGFTVKVVDYFWEWLGDARSLNKLLNLIIDQQTLFIGFSGTSMIKATANLRTTSQAFLDYSAAHYDTPMTYWPIEQNKIAVWISGIKKRFPKIKFVYGGLMNDQEWINRGRSGDSLVDIIDYTVQGFGEKAIIDIANHLSDSKNKIQYFPKGKVKMLNQDNSLFDFRNFGDTIYEKSDILSPDDMLYIETSRGCPFNCSYCTYPLRGRNKRDSIPYHKSADVFADELKRNYDLAGITKYSFIDSVFNESTEKLEDLLRARDKSGIDINCSAFVRYELINKFPEQKQLLKELGLKMIGMGIESLHTPSAKTVGKGMNSEKVKNILYDLKSYWGDDIMLSGSLVIGLPEENPDTLEKWVPWILEKDCPITFGYIFPLSFNNGSIFTDAPEKYGYTILENGAKWRNKYWDSDTVWEYTRDIQAKNWNLGLRKLTAFGFMSWAAAGFDYKYLSNTGMRNLDHKKMNEINLSKWQKYRELLIQNETDKLINTRCE